MRFADWEPHYIAILEYFGFEREADEAPRLMAEGKLREGVILGSRLHDELIAAAGNGREPCGGIRIALSGWHLRERVGPALRVALFVVADREVHREVDALLVYVAAQCLIAPAHRGVGDV